MTDWLVRTSPEARPSWASEMGFVVSAESEPEARGLAMAEVAVAALEEARTWRRRFFWLLLLSLLYVGSVIVAHT